MQNQSQNCQCPRKECKNHGDCNICNAKHKAAGNLPFCLRQKSLNFDSNGTNIFYTKSGQGQPLIFVHGNMASGQFFKDCPKLFKDFTVFLPDSRSHGKSDSVKRLNYDDMADDIVRLIDHEKMVKPILFGFSDGAIVGTLIAIKHPDLLGKLFAAGINLTPKGINGFWRFVARAVFCLAFPFKFGDKMRLMLTQPNILAKDIKTIKTPTIALFAQNDIVKKADSQTLADNAADGKLIIIEGENHGSYIADNQKLYNILKEHLIEYMTKEKAQDKANEK